MITKYNLYTIQLNAHHTEVTSLQSRKAKFVQVRGWTERLSQSCPPPASPSQVLSSGAKRMVRGYLFLVPHPSWTTTLLWEESTEETKSGAITAAEQSVESFISIFFTFYSTWQSPMPSSYKRATVRTHLSALSRSFDSSWPVSS